jgi:hypothetical protein
VKDIVIRKKPVIAYLKEEGTFKKEATLKTSN